MIFSETLRALRKRNNLTQKRLAEYVNLSRSAIAGYESQRKQPSFETVLIISSYFRVSVDYLLTGKESAYITLDVSTAMPDDERELLKRYRRLPGSLKNALLRYLRHLEAQNKTEVHLKE